MAVRQPTGARAKGRIGATSTPPVIGTPVFDADFSGTAESAFRTADWTSFGNTTAYDWSSSPPRSGNAVYDGSGNLILRCKRETSFSGEISQFPPASFSGRVHRHGRLRHRLAADRPEARLDDPVRYRVARQAPDHAWRLLVHVGDVRQQEQHDPGRHRD
jgi:hypothetical protein